MPSVQKSCSWFSRIDGPKEHLTAKLQILAVETTTCLAVFHLGQNGEHPHVHICCTVLKELQKQSWDTKIKKLFDIDKKHNYSSKVWDANLDSEGAGTYLFHESVDSPLLCTKGVQPETLEALKSQAKLINKVIENNKQKAETKIPGKVLEVWEAQGKPDWSEIDIVYCICAIARDGGCYLPKSDYLFKAYVEEVKLRMSTTPQQFDKFCRDTYQRLYRFNS